jgi:hypothetical protein
MMSICHSIFPKKHSLETDNAIVLLFWRTFLVNHHLHIKAKPGRSLSTGLCLTHKQQGKLKRRWADAANLLREAFAFSGGGGCSQLDLQLVQLLFTLSAAFDFAIALDSHTCGPPYRVIDIKDE